MSESSGYLVVYGADDTATREVMERRGLTGLVTPMNRKFHCVIALPAAEDTLLSELAGGVLKVRYAKDHGLAMTFYERGQQVGVVSLEWEVTVRVDLRLDRVVEAGLLQPAQLEAIEQVVSQVAEQERGYQESELDADRVDGAAVYRRLCAAIGVRALRGIDASRILGSSREIFENHADAAYFLDGSRTALENPDDLRVAREVAGYDRRQLEATRREVEGLPDLVFLANPPPWRFSGDTGELVVSFGNKGGAFRGLSVTCSSALLDGKTMSLKSATVAEKTGGVVATSEPTSDQRFDFPALAVAAAVDPANPTVREHYVFAAEVRVASPGSGLLRLTFQASKASSRGSALTFGQLIVFSRRV